MSHLSDTGFTYLQHLKRSWKLSFVLFIHGLFPNIWQTKASDELCKDNKTRNYLLEKQYGIKK